MLRRAAILTVTGGLLATAPISPAAERAAGEAEPVRALQIAPGPTWDEQQYAAADKKGRVFILRTETLEVFPVEGGELGEPRALETANLGDPDPVLDAAMDKHGDWVILDGFQPRWFRSGEEEQLPQPPWLPSSVELLDGRPVVTVFPFPIGRYSRKGTPPRVLAFDGNRWTPLVDGDLDRPTTATGRMKVRQEQAAHTFVDPDDTLWLAYHHRYKIERYSSAGRRLLSYEADGAEVAHHEEADLEERRLKLEEERARYANPGRATILVNTAVPLIRGITEGRDGRIYLLIREDGGGLSLDRIDTVQGLAARVATTATTPGAISMVAGRDGLFLVPYRGTDERWLISWESLDAADWSPLDGIEGLAPAVAPPE